MLQLVVKQGIHGTSMSQLARETGIGTSTIYYYFDSKLEIINEIYRMIRKDFDSVLSQKKEGKSSEEIFKTYWKNLYQYYVSNPMAFEFYEFIARPPIISQQLIDETKAYFLSHTKYFKEEIKNGSLKNMDLSLLVQLAVNTVVAAVSLKLNNTITMNKKQLDDSVNAAWDLVRKNDS